MTVESPWRTTTTTTTRVPFRIAFLALIVALRANLASGLRCTECPYSPFDSAGPQECNTTCLGDQCYIVVNAFFNHTISAGCINLPSSQAPIRQSCYRDPPNNRTVCACSSGDLCNDPKTPIATYEFVMTPILEGFSLRPPTPPTVAVILPQPSMGPGVVLSTDPPSSFHPVDYTNAGTYPPPLPSMAPPLPPLPSEPSQPPGQMQPIATTRARFGGGARQLPTDDDEEGLIEVKSSVFIKPKQGTNDNAPPTPFVFSSTPGVFTTPFLFSTFPSSTGPPVLPGTIEQLDVREVPPNRGPPTMGAGAHVLPTDPAQMVGPDGEIVVVRTVGLEVKDNETGAVPEIELSPPPVSLSPLGGNPPGATSGSPGSLLQGHAGFVGQTQNLPPHQQPPLPGTVKDTESRQRAPMGPPANLAINKKGIGEGSIEETEVSTRVQMAGGTHPTAGRQTARPRQPDRPSSAQKPPLFSGTHAILAMLSLIVMCVYG